MEYKLSDNVVLYIKRAFPDLLKNKGNVFLEKPFGGFFISFDKNQSKGTLIKEYSAQEIGLERKEIIYLFCGDIM